MIVVDGARYAVAEATGRVAAQANCTVREAIVLLSDRARELDQTIDEVALGVIDRRLVFYDKYVGSRAAVIARAAVDRNCPELPPADHRPL